MMGTRVTFPVAVANVALFGVSIGAQRLFASVAVNFALR